MIQADTQPDTKSPRRWTVVAAGLLLLLLALVVTYTSRRAFLSPLALVVVAGIGVAALLLQLRLRNSERTIHAPLWLNILAIAFAAAAVGADVFRLGAAVLLAAALAAVVCFAISGIVVLGAMRKGRV